MKYPFHLSRELWLHIAGIIIFLSMPVLFSPDLQDAITLFQVPPFQREFITYLLLVAFFYTSYLLLIPQLYFQRKWFYFFLSVLICLMIIQFIPGLLIPRPHGLHPGPAGHHPRGSSPLFMGHNVMFSIAILFLAFTLRMNNQWKKTQKEKLDTELSYLKAQINPHFLFNTLNSIYSLAIQKSDDTASAIVKLSGMMRYAISEAHQDMVSLQKEITYITDYIELQKLRIDDSVKLSYTVTGNAVGKKIAPFILIPFIENAFKFGVNAEKDSNIVIHIDMQESHLLLFVANYKVNENADRNGLGIKNTKSRLELLYPGKYELEMKDLEKKFQVSLKLYFV